MNHHHRHHHHHLSLYREGRWGTTDDFATSFLHFSLFSTAPWDLANSRPVYSLMLSSHLFLCPPCLLPPFTVPCKMVLARPDERETYPYHCRLRLFTMVRSSCGPITCWILARISSLVTWSLYEMCSILCSMVVSSNNYTVPWITMMIQNYQGTCKDFQNCNNLPMSWITMILLNVSQHG